MAISVGRLRNGHNRGGCNACNSVFSHVEVTVGMSWLRFCMPCFRELQKAVNGVAELTASKGSKR